LHAAPVDDAEGHYLNGCDVVIDGDIFVIGVHDSGRSGAEDDGWRVAVKIEEARVSGTLATADVRLLAMLLRNRISDGLYSPGQKMPTQEELEQEFGVARVTVRQAVELLETEGLVQRQQGRGTFVARQMPERRWLHLTMDINGLPRPCGTAG
jgi:hypothetical protein